MGLKKFLKDVAKDLKVSLEEKREQRRHEQDEKREQRRRAQERKREQRRRAQEEQREYKAKVNDLLDKFEIPDLDNFLMKILNKKPEPHYKKDRHTGREHKMGPSRKDYFSFVWKHLKQNEINYQQLRDFSLKHRIVTPSFFGEESGVELEKAEFQNLINSIRTGFEPEKIEMEEHLQSQLAVFLKAKYPERKISREVSTKYGDRIDIVIDDAYAFELKVPETRAALRNLSAQLEEYVEQYPNLCAVIYDNQEKNLSQTIIDYADKYKRNYGVQTIIVTGTKGQRPV